MINLIAVLESWIFTVNEICCSTIIVFHKIFMYKNKVKNKDNLTLISIEIKFEA